MTLVGSTDKPLKSFDELMSTPIDFSAYIMNGLKIINLTQETLLGPAFRLLKGTRSNYAELEYNFEECIEDMVLNIWVPVKVSYDKHAFWGILHWREQQVVVRRADNDLYRFKEGDFPRLRINDIEDMLLLVVQNRLTNLSGDDVSDFAIALRMFTRSLVIQKRFSDGTLTRLLTSLEDITNHINMEYLPKRRWSTLEKKRAHIMIKAINKLQKERRIMRILEKFVGGKHYGTDLQLLQ
ncbi:hypothetical protein Tco_0884927 [Tanacetum coccineum]